MNFSTSSNLSQVIREAPTQFKESINHRIAIGRSASAKVMKQGTRPCDVAQFTFYPPEHKEMYNHDSHHRDGINQQNRLEKIMLSRGKVSELSEKNMNKILQNDFYYTDFNEIRSINEFLYIKNNLAVNQHTKRIQSLRDDLKKKQKQIQSIIQKEQDLDQDEHRIAAHIDFASYHKYLIGQKMSLTEQTPSRNINSSQSARTHYKGNAKTQEFNRIGGGQQHNNISPFNDDNIMLEGKQAPQQISYQTQNISKKEQMNSSNDAILIMSPQTIAESAKEDSTHAGDLESFNSPIINNFKFQDDSVESTAMHSYEGHQIKLFPEYLEGGIDHLIKNQKLSTISERDSELIFQKENYDSYRSMMGSIDSQNILKAKVVDMNTMYEMFQTKQSNNDQSNLLKPSLSPRDIQQYKNNTMPGRIRNSQYTNEESLNDGSEVVSSQCFDDMNSKYNTQNLPPKLSQNINSNSQSNLNTGISKQNRIGARSLSAHMSNRQQDKYVSVPTQTTAGGNLHTSARRKSSQHSVYLNTQLQYANPTTETNLQQIAQMPVYKCTFKKRSKNTKNSDVKSPTSGKKEGAEEKYYSQYTMKEADRFLLNQQIVNGFKQKQNTKQFRENMLLYQSIKTSKMFNDRIEEALQVKSKEYDQKYNQFSTQTNFTQRQSRSSCEARVSSAFLKVSQIKNLQPPQTKSDFYHSPFKTINPQQTPPIQFSQYEQAITELTNSQQNDETKLTSKEQQISVNSQLQLDNSDTTKQKLDNLITLFNQKQDNNAGQLDESENINLNTQNSESTAPTYPVQKYIVQSANKSNGPKLFVKLNSSVRNSKSPVKVSNIKTTHAELFNTHQSIQETQQRIQDNLKKIDNNLKKERDYLAKMNMIKKQLKQSQSVETVRHVRSQSQPETNNNSELKISSYQPKRARLSRAEISKMFKTSEQIQMHKEIGLFNRITYNNFISKDKKNKILLKNCNYVEFYQ